MRLSDPMHEPSRQRLRTLKNAKAATDGIRVVTRSGGRAHGSATYYSGITALAAAVRQGGDEPTAARLAEAGGRIEARFRDLIRNYLAHSSIAELGDAPFYNELLRETRAAIDFVWQDLDGGNLMIGQVKTTRQDFSEIETKYMGEAARVDLPTILLRQSDLHTGDSVWIVRRVLNSAALLMVLPAVAAVTSEGDAQDLRDAAFVDSEGESLGRQYMEQGPGSPISDAEAAFFAALKDDDLPTARVLRLAG